MKKILFPMVCAVAFAACNNSDNSSTTTDSTQTTSSTSTTTGTGSSTASADVNGGAGFSSSSYVDLKSGKTIKVRRDSSTGYATNAEGNDPIMYYYDPVSSDTFDRSGRVINGAIMKGTSGDWTVDESKIKIQGDGDVKMKYEDGSKEKIDADGNNSKMKSGDTKEKVSDDKYKSKTPDEKVKIKDDKMKVKSSGQ